MKIEYIREYKKNRKLYFNKINYANVIAMRLHLSGFTSFIKEFYLLFFYEFDLIINNNDLSNAYYYSLSNANRSDYDEISNNYLKIINTTTYINVIHSKKINKTFFKILLFFKVLLIIILRGVKNPLITSLIIVKYIILEKKLIKEIDFSKLKFIVTFCDAYPPDNLFTQLCKIRNIKTATLQHGQYRILSKPNENADIEAYENFISDYMFSWGEATQREFNKFGIDEDRVIPIGALKWLSFVNKEIDWNDNLVFGVVLSADIYKESNKSMIELANQFAQKYNYKYVLRFHPRSDKNFYNKFINYEYVVHINEYLTTLEYISLVDFSVIHMTGVFVELLNFNSPIMIYKDSYLEELFIIESFCFKDLDELVNVNNLYKTEKILCRKILEQKAGFFNFKSNSIKNNYIDAANSIIKFGRYSK
jgi:hypothetical protein